MKKPLISIVIPTRNRIPFCISTIESILNIPDSRLELVVQDNSDSKELEDYVNNNIKDERLKYCYTSAAFSSIDNFNAGMELSTGEYVCFIGDDDGINPEIIEAAAWAKNNQIDVLTPKLKATYLWPGSHVSNTLFTEVFAGSLTVYPYTGKIKEVNCESVISKFLIDGGINYLDYDLPKSYHGLVKRECMDLIKCKTGNYFGGLSLDIYSALALSCIAKRVIIIDYPLTIAGSCPVAELTHSNEERIIKIEDAPHFRNRSFYVWNKLIPSFYSGKTIWLESGVAALKAMERNDLVNKLDMVKFSADCIFSYPQKTKMICSEMKFYFEQKSINLFLGYMGLIYLLIRNRICYLNKKIFIRIQILLGIKKICRFNSVNDMQIATILLEKNLKSNNNVFVDFHELKPNF